MVTHLFNPKIGNSSKCSTCDGMIEDHTCVEKDCESCGAVASECYQTKENMFLCAVCSRQHYTAQALSEYDKNGAIDISYVRNYGDFFNAEISSFVDIKKGIDADESVIDKDARFAELVATRRNHLVEIVKSYNDALFQVNQELAASETMLTNIGARARDDIRKRLQEHDEKYKPVVAKAVKPKVAKKATTAESYIEKAIQIIMGNNPGMSHAEASKIVTGA